MKFRIGVDLDNTIVCYDHVFLNVAKQLGLIEGEYRLSKSEVKEKILSKPEGEKIWQKLQGQVYGKYMHLASLFPGFIEFLCLSKQRGHAVFIVSHKTEYGHFDEDKVPLRKAAMDWLYANKLIGIEEFAFSKEEIFFKSTRASKAEQIGALELTHFIDDLKEVFEEPSFPEKTQKILFDVTTTSWRTITQNLHEEWSNTEVSKAVRERFPMLEVQSAELIKGRGNSQIFKLIGSEGKKYALKIYPDRQFDERPRLETEFSATRLLKAKKFPVTEAVAKDEPFNWAVYGWISGNRIHSPGKDFIEEAASFVEQLLIKSRFEEDAEGFFEASEACLSGTEIVRQIQERFLRLTKIDSSLLKQFLYEEFLPSFKFSVETAQKDACHVFGHPLSRSLQILSPSDFGSHNAIRTESGQTVFIDFEYFGWDDPVKLVCDFYFHPGMNLSEELKANWIWCAKRIFQSDSSFETRLTAYLPLFGLRWCLIALNEFLPKRLNQRIHADHDKLQDIENMLLTQLNKARDLLIQVNKIFHVRPAVQIS